MFNSPITVNNKRHIMQIILKDENQRASMFFRGAKVAKHTEGMGYNNATKTNAGSGPSLYLQRREHKHKVVAASAQLRCQPRRALKSSR